MEVWHKITMLACGLRYADLIHVSVNNAIVLYRSQSCVSNYLQWVVFEEKEKSEQHVHGMA